MRRRSIEKVVLAIDIGTSSVRTALFGERTRSPPGPNISMASSMALTRRAPCCRLSPAGTDSHPAGKRRSVGQKIIVSGGILQSPASLQILADSLGPRRAGLREPGSVASRHRGARASSSWALKSFRPPKQWKNDPSTIEQVGRRGAPTVRAADALEERLSCLNVAQFTHFTISDRALSTNS